MRGLNLRYVEETYGPDWRTPKLTWDNRTDPFCRVS